MTKGFRYWFRCTTVATLTALITFNPAWAGRGIRAIFGKRAAVYCETDPVANVCCPAVPEECCVPACDVGSSLSTDCCPNPSIVQECCEPSSSIIDNQPMHSEESDLESPAAPSAAAESKPAESKPAETKPAVPAPAPQRVVEPQAETSPSDNAAETAPAKETPAFPTEPAQPAPALGVDAPVESDAKPAVDNSLFGEPEAKPADSAPAAADPFGAPAEAEPAAPAGNDPFGAPAEAEPAAPAGDDPFGAPAETEPAAPAGNDPFGAPAAETTPAAPAGEDPFGAAPAESKSGLPAIDDLFDVPGSDVPGTEAAPSEAAPTEAAGNELFGTPTPESSENLFGEPEAAPAAVSLFGEPEPEPASPAPTTDVEGLFGTPTEDNSDQDEDADAAAADEAADPISDLFGESTSASPVGNDFNDLFGTPAVVEETQPEVTTAPAPADDIFKSTRTWHDNTGLFEVDAQLVVIFADSVRLLKDNGKFCTLPIRRLSDHDQRFVEQVAQLLPGSDAKYVSAAK